MNKMNTVADLKHLKRTLSMENSRGSHHYIVLSYLYEWMETVAVKYAKGKLLDFGCGGQTYRELFIGYIEKYIGADVAQASEVKLDIQIGVNQPLPLQSESIDTVLSNQVLEHVLDPGYYLSEAARVIKTGGALILSAPMQWRFHEVPFDYFRFTKFGLIELLEKHGFAVIRIDPCGGVFALIGQIFCSYLAENRITYCGWIYQILNRSFLWLDRKLPDTEDTLNWMCIAIKKEKG